MEYFWCYEMMAARDYYGFTRPEQRRGDA
jgi:hypothetical protein